MSEPQDVDRVDSLSERFDRYKEIVEGIVLRGIEDPSCELKRSLNLGRENLRDRLEFLLQLPVGHLDLSSGPL